MDISTLIFCKSSIFFSIVCRAYTFIMMVQRSGKMTFVTSVNDVYDPFFSTSICSIYKFVNVENILVETAKLTSTANSH